MSDINVGPTASSFVLGCARTSRGRCTTSCAFRPRRCWRCSSDTAESERCRAAFGERG